jgi:hypothetical protein
MRRASPHTTPLDPTADDRLLASGHAPILPVKGTSFAGKTGRPFVYEA